MGLARANPDFLDFPTFPLARGFASGFSAVLRLIRYHRIRQIFLPIMPDHARGLEGDFANETCLSNVAVAASHATPLRSSIRHFPFMRVAPFASTVMVALAASSCANLKFWDRGEAPAEEPTPAVTATAAPARTDAIKEPVENPEQPAFIDDGLRLPDMLSLPSERDLRRAPPEPDSSGTAGVTARPPSDSKPDRD